MYGEAGHDVDRCEGGEGEEGGLVVGAGERAGKPEEQRLYVLDEGGD